MPARDVDDADDAIVVASIRADGRRYGAMMMLLRYAFMATCSMSGARCGAPRCYDYAMATPEDGMRRVAAAATYILLPRCHTITLR